MKNHQLKTHNHIFQDVWDRNKTFEVRFDDRDFQVGDTVTLLDYNPNKDTYNPRTIHAEISYKLHGSYGVKKGYCVLQLSKLSNWLLDENGLPNFLK